MKKKLLAILMVLLIGLPASALLAEINHYPLEINRGTRPLGMGGAFVGLADDLNAILYNPGGLAWAKGLSLNFKDSGNIESLQSYPTGYGQSFALGFIASNISGITMGTRESTSASNLLVLSYGTKLSQLKPFADKPLFQRLGLGVTVKGLLGQNLKQTGSSDQSAVGWDLDLGLLWKASSWGRMGLSLQNILPQGTLGAGVLKWTASSDEDIPAAIKLGGSAKLIGKEAALSLSEKNQFIVSGQLDFVKAATLFHLGSEAIFNNRFILRTGLDQQVKPSGTVNSSLNFGLGLKRNDWQIAFSSFYQGLREQRVISFSLSYLPQDWILVKQLDFEKPLLVLGQGVEKISLKDNATTYDQEIAVSGQIKEGVVVKINGSKAFVNNKNQFATTVPLKIGKNLILVETSYQGEDRSFEYKVFRKNKVVIAEEEEIKKKLKQPLSSKEKQALLKKQQEVGQAKEKVELMSTMGIIEIKPEEELVLESAVTRGELSSWLVKAAGYRLPALSKDPFIDVKKTDPLAPYVKVMADLKLLLPFSDGSFKPNMPVTKEESKVIFAYFGVEQ